MRLRNIKGADEAVASDGRVIQKSDQLKGKWSKLFGNNNPIHVEIGMGKGKFITSLAERNPDVNYIGIEKYSSVLLRALQKMTEREENNLFFICMDADEIMDVFNEEEVDQIYLNFSDPWPKDRHQKRRLPSRNFLKKFSMILKKGGVLEFKTDNRILFDFALEEIDAGGFQLLQHTFDLHADRKMCQENIMTEYEEKFSLNGNPICKYRIQKKEE